MTSGRSLTGAIRSAAGRIRRELPGANVIVGILVIVFGFFAFEISIALGFFALGSGAMMLTWQLPLRLAHRALLYLIILLPVLHWFDRAAAALFPAQLRSQPNVVSTSELLFRYGFAAAAVLGLVVILRHRTPTRRAAATAGQSTRNDASEKKWTNVPRVAFRDVGGLWEQKERIAAIVKNRLHPDRYERHGVVQNGILLYGPRGTGKTFIAEATAGEFRINFWHVSPNKFIEGPIGTSEANIRDAFARAYQHRPILMFIDELDAIGTQRQQLGKNDDRGGAARAYNAIVTELMQCIDRYRNEPELVIMAATNFYDGLDEALIRDMRFDEKIRIDLPDEATRAEILSAQLSKRPWQAFAVEPYAKRTPSWSAARLTGLVNRAASYAAAENRRVEEQDLERALGETGGVDRPLFKEVHWEDLILAPDVEADLRNLIRLMRPGESQRIDVSVPTGLLLIGPPGTGKTSIGQLIATETRRSFYAITPADVPSTEKLQQVFSRARDNSPSVLFIDEIDGLLPASGRDVFIGHHHRQLVDEALLLMSQLDPENQVFLIGTTNHIENVDPRVLRGGRFTEKVEVALPDQTGYVRLLDKYVGTTRLDGSLTREQLLVRLRGISPADLQALVQTAKRMAMNRMRTEAADLPPLVWQDFEQAMRRNRVALHRAQHSA